MRVAEYDPSRRADVAGLMERVWGERPSEDELEWFYERNPVRPASVLLAEEDGKVVGTAAMSFQRMSVGGEEVEVGMPVRIATDPDYQGRGIFGRLEAENEERVAGMGVRLLLTVPNEASAPGFVKKLGWSPLPAIRVWARLRPWRGRLHPQTRHGGPIGTEAVSRYLAGPGDRVLRDAAWLQWRFFERRKQYRLFERDGYAVVGRRGRVAFVAALAGDMFGDAAAGAASTGGVALIAATPPWERGRYARHGYVPTPKTFTLLGKSLGHPIPARPHFELGDLDFL